MTKENTEQMLDSMQCIQPSLRSESLFGDGFDPSKYSEKVVELNGGKTPVCRQEFPLSIVQKSGNYMEGTL